MFVFVVPPLTRSAQLGCAFCVYECHEVMRRMSLHQIIVALDVLTNALSVIQLDCLQYPFIVSIHEFPSVLDAIYLLCHNRRLIFLPLKMWEDEQRINNQL